MELGIYTFGDITPDPNSGRAISTAQRYAEILAAAKFADEAGLHSLTSAKMHLLAIFAEEDWRRLGRTRGFGFRKAALQICRSSNRSCA